MPTTTTMPATTTSAAHPMAILAPVLIRTPPARRDTSITPLAPGDLLRCRPMARRFPARLALLFIGSGFTAVAYQVLLSRYVHLIVGATAYAVSALLVAFMLG